MNKLAWIGLGVALGVGCGKIDGSHSAHLDAPTGDGTKGVDAAMTGSVNVITQAQVAGVGSAFDPKTPTPGIVVVAVNADNTTLSDMQTTDGNGSGSVAITAGGSVTAVYPHTGSDMGADLVTYFGVQPSDTLTFGSWTGQTQDTTTNLGTVTLTWATPAGVASTNQYEFFSPCTVGTGPVTATGTAVTVTLKTFSWCNKSPFEIQGTVTTVGNGRLFTSLAPTLTNGNATVNSGITWGAGQTVTATLSTLPAEVDDAEAVLTPVLDGQIEGLDVFVDGPPVNNIFSGSGAYGGAGDRTLAEARLERDGSFGAAFLYDSLQTGSGAFTGTSWSVAVPNLAPWLAGVIGNISPTSTVGDVLWFISTTPGAMTFNGTVVSLPWAVTTNVGGNNTTSTFRWTAIVPPDVTTIAIPALPSALGAFAPQNSNGNALRPAVQLIQIPGVAGYDGLRAVPARDLQNPSAAVANGEFPRIIVDEQSIVERE